MAKASKGAGGKQSRSEIIQARLSPKMRFAAELMARNQRRTLSSMIEILIENAYKDVDIEMPSSPDNPKSGVFVKLGFMLDQLWSPDEALRFVRLAFTFPQLLNGEEEKRWMVIRETPYFWVCYQQVLIDKADNQISSKWSSQQTLQTILIDNVREYWDVLNVDEIDRNKLPSNDIPGDLMKIRGHEGKIPVINVRLNADLTPLNPTQQQQWLEAYINRINDPSCIESSDYKAAEKYQIKLAEQILRGVCDDNKV